MAPWFMGRLSSSRDASLASVDVRSLLGWHTREEEYSWLFEKLSSMSCDKELLSLHMLRWESDNFTIRI